MRHLVVCGPSGAGKTTLVEMLIADPDHCYTRAVTHTSRAPRQGERDGVDYHYATRQRMEEMMGAGELVEWTSYAGNYYGLSFAALEAAAATGRGAAVILDIEGVRQVRARGLDAVYVFVTAPSARVLAERLAASRGAEECAGRLRTLEAEMLLANGPNEWDLVLVNESLERAFSELVRFCQHALP
jgi:guanylate kinase